jgi:hypothetical protein
MILNFKDGDSWVENPIEQKNMSNKRSFHSSVVYNDFQFLFGTVPGIEIKSLGKIFAFRFGTKIL